jgi:drug/metabolite transporter (DMT)-like permease
MAGPPSATTRGALWVTAAMMFFSVQPVMVRYLSDTIPVTEQVFFRGLFVVLLFLPWSLRNGWSALGTRRLPLIGVRSVFIAIGAVTFFYAVARMPLAEAVALHFTLPLFGMVAAMIYLRERPPAHRWIATAIGFAGALVILRPGFIPVDTVALMVLFSALCYALGSVLTKELVRTEPTDVVVLYMNVYSVLLFSLPTWMYWVPPTPGDWLMLIALGVVTLLAHVCYTRGVAATEVSYLFAFEFLRLPLAALAGLALFAEVPDIWTAIGAAIIFGATYFTTWRERRAEGT